MYFNIRPLRAYLKAFIHKKKKYKKRIFFPTNYKEFIFIVFCGFILLGCEEKKEAAHFEIPAVPVVASSPVSKEVILYLESIGTLKPSILSEIRPKIDGTISEINVSEGQWVKADTPLFNIDSKPYKIKVQEAEAQILVDQAILNGINKKLNRLKLLTQKELVALTEWEDLEAELEKCRAMLALDKLRLKQAKLDLEHCTVLSPSAGRVGKIDIYSGMLVSKGQEKPLTTVSQMGSLIVEFSLTEKEFAQFSKELHSIKIKPLCSSGDCQNGAITFLDNHFDPTTGLILIRGRVANDDHTLRPGQSVQVHVPIGIEKNALLIPQKAIRYNQQGPYIYVVQPDMTVALRQIVLGEEQGSDQMIKEGLDSSELFIVDGHLRLSPGLKVEIKS